MNDAATQAVVALHGMAWLALFLHFASLSLLAVGGAITTIPDMNRYLVGQQHWLTDTQFTASVAIAQSSPGPNVLFVGLLGWHAGSASGWLAGLAGMTIAMTGILLPSSVLTLVAARWAQRNRERLGVRAFKAGLAPLTVGLITATGWVLMVPPAQWHGWRSLVITAVALLLMWRTRIHLLWLVAGGAVAGALGFY
ncbi:MAG: Chromate transport protein [Paracidovorax wautersii]|uniref:Chromate transport protein n=1 Tax=Paracidovorax wautersii TaxID=1177982 RepID=A0A7V8JPH8_9BURK|nr:MAG: Chromate transport protein [Paracidovorax wautersii]